MAIRGKAEFIRSLDGYVLSKTDYENELGEANHLFDKCLKLEAENARLREVISDLFTHCAMIHKYWGEACNSKEAAAAIAAAHAAIKGK